MLSFFNKKTKKTGMENTVSSEELLNIKNDGHETENEVFTELSIHPLWNISDEEKYVYQFLNVDCPPLKPNQISLFGIDLVQNDGIAQVKAFIRNSLNKSIKLGETNLALLNEDGSIILQQNFQLGEIGEIPAKSSRPWIFTFLTNDIEIPKDNWSIAFLLPKKHELDLDEVWEQSLSEADKNKLNELVNSIAPPKQGEVNFMCISAKQTDDGSLHITLLIRNGSNNNVNLEQLPLIVEDATGETIAQGGFTLENLQIKANTSKPWTFVFPQPLLMKENPDLSKWKAYPPQN